MPEETTGERPAAIRSPGGPPGSRASGRSWLRERPAMLAGALAGEVFGTYLLVFLGTGTVLATKLLLAPSAPLDATAICLAFGFAVVAAVFALGHVSGAHINPSVTLGLAAIGRFPWRIVPAYLAAQIGGAVLASLTLWAIFGDQARSKLLLGATTPGPRGTGIALLAEVVITFFLLVTISAIALDDRSAGPLAAGVAIGLVVAAGIFAALPVSGGSLNAARTFGPMLVSGQFPGWWAYLIGPAAGGVAGALFYDRLLRRGVPPGAGREG